MRCRQMDCLKDRWDSNQSRGGKGGGPGRALGVWKLGYVHNVTIVLFLAQSKYVDYLGQHGTLSRRGCFCVGLFLRWRQLSQGGLRFCGKCVRFCAHLREKLNKITLVLIKKGALNRGPIFSSQLSTDQRSAESQVKRNAEQ